jgi:hypothetical protein
MYQGFVAFVAWRSVWKVALRSCKNSASFFAIGYFLKKQLVIMFMHDPSQTNKKMLSTNMW